MAADPDEALARGRRGGCGGFAWDWPMSKGERKNWVIISAPDDPEDPVDIQKIAKKIEEACSRKPAKTYVQREGNLPWTNFRW